MRFWLGPEYPLVSPPWPPPSPALCVPFPERWFAMYFLPLGLRPCLECLYFSSSLSSLLFEAQLKAPPLGRPDSQSPLHLCMLHVGRGRKYSTLSPALLSPGVGILKCFLVSPKLRFASLKQKGNATKPEWGQASISYSHWAIHTLWCQAVVRIISFGMRSSWAWGLNESMYIKDLAQRLAHRRCGVISSHC